MPAAPLHPLVGKVVGDKYRVERLIGKGGMGVVFAARHVQLGSVVALKFMRSEVLEVDRAPERFMREARIAASLQSEHVVRIFDVDVDHDGTPFIAMELLEGEALSTRLKREPVLPVRLSLEFGLAMCTALSEAHAHNFVHRDLKPANMFLANKWGGGGVLKLLDFGISKIQADKVQLTATDTALGSPAFMAPEQMLSAQSVDNRADIWSLGVCLYQFLCGKLPFDSNNVWEVSLLVTTQEPPALASLAPGVPPALAAAVHRCLAKDPAERFQTAEALADALNACLLDLPAADAPAVELRSSMPAPPNHSLREQASEVAPIVSAAAPAKPQEDSSQTAETRSERATFGTDTTVTATRMTASANLDKSATGETTPDFVLHRKARTRRLGVAALALLVAAGGTVGVLAAGVNGVASQPVRAPADKHVQTTSFSDPMALAPIASSAGAAQEASTVLVSAVVSARATAHPSFAAPKSASTNKIGTHAAMAPATAKATTSRPYTIPNER